MLFIIASWCVWYCAIVGIGKLVLAVAEKFNKKKVNVQVQWDGVRTGRSDLTSLPEIPGRNFCQIGAARRECEQLQKSHPSPTGGLYTFEFFWLGFTFLVAFAGLLQVFYPLNGKVLGVCFLGGVIGCFLGKKRKWQGINIVLFIVVLTVSLPCMSPDGTLPFSYDTGLYHLSVVRWINEYATVPGLANLHTRLGYGMASSFFTFAALFDNWIWDGRSAWMIVSFLLAAVLAQVLYGLLSMKTARVKIYSFVCFLYLLLELLLFRPGLYFDSPVFYVLIVAGFYIVDMTDKKQNFSEIAEGKYFAFYIVPSIMMFAFTIKPMAAVLLLFCLMVYGTIFFKCTLGGDRSHLFRVAITSIVPLLLLLGYLSRNTITSGWPFFPVPYGKITALWSLPRESVENEYRVIKNWASGSEFSEAKNKPFCEWSSNWLLHNFNKFDGLTFFLPLLLTSIAVLRYLTQKKRCGLYLTILAALLLSLILWFFSSPDIRFARGFVWLLCAFAILALYEAEIFPGFYSVFLRHLPKIVTAVTVVGEILLFSIVLPYRNFEFSLWFTGKAVSLPTKPVVLRNGQTPPLVIWVPENSDRCGDAPLPCTPYPDDRLCLFVPGNLAKGFYMQRE
ncbi:MAG: hypothetical protein LBP21_10805 [Synergistaceae bacterium]|jgi:hypothetical protein|nr:hypothetical protein [Synergistaceae bacterium]